MGTLLPAFKAYDIRGKVPSELNPDLAYAIGRAYADEIGPSRVCIGYDIRLSGPGLADALTEGLTSAGVDVVHLGLVGTEMVYFATAHYEMDGGIMITASHNPPEYNGMKLVREQSRPISGDSGLHEIKRRAHEGKWERNGAGKVEKLDAYEDFVAHLLALVNVSSFEPLKVLCDPGNGAAGPALDALLPKLPFEVEKFRWEADGSFPNGVPNPILEEARAPVENLLRQTGEEKGFDFAVAWDGDYDRCFFLDGAGNFIEGYYIVGVLAQAILSEDPKQTIIYDPRLTWNTLEIVEKMGGRAVVCKSGHAFIKEKMRAEDAIYGGEMSAHHYFRPHWYCDSGMIPFLLIAQLISKTGTSLHDMVSEMMERFPCSGEINSTVESVSATLAKVEAKYGPGGRVDRLDGLSVEFPEWRFNLRGSQTEPVIRLNVETRGDKGLLEEKTQDILSLVRA
jgi:phosphomannomutase